MGDEGSVFVVVVVWKWGAGGGVSFVLSFQGRSSTSAFFFREGKLAVSDVYPLPGTSGLTLDATFLPLLLSSPFALPAFSFFCSGATLLPVFLKFQRSFVFVVLLKDQLFCLAHVLFVFGTDGR